MARKKKIPTLDPWRRPDFDGQEHGFESVWWGPGDVPEDAEAFTEVRDTCVTEYRFVGGYEGFDDDDWLVISTCLDEDDLPAKPVWHQGRTLHPDDHRVVAAYGVNEIFEREVAKKTSGKPRKSWNASGICVAKTTVVIMRPFASSRTVS